jgi:hypothetical protein
MAKRPARKGNGAARSDPDEQRRRQQKAMLRRVIRDERAIVALGKQLTKTSHLAQRSMLELHTWLTHRLRREASEHSNEPRGE